MKTEVIERIVTSASDRRKCLNRVGATGIGVAAASMAGSSFLGKAAYASTTITDADILNFALNVEYPEAEFYSMATYGSTLLELGVRTKAQESGPTTGGNMVPDFGASPLAFLATALRGNEINHVKYLRAALGSAAVKTAMSGMAADEKTAEINKSEREEGVSKER